MNDQFYRSFPAFFAESGEPIVDLPDQIIGFNSFIRGAFSKHRFRLVTDLTGPDYRILKRKCVRYTWPQTLSGNLNETEIAHLEHLGHRPVLSEFVAQMVKYLTSIFRLTHIDEINHKNAPEIAQPDLLCDKSCRFQVDSDRIFFLG